MSAPVANIDIITQNWELALLKINRLADLMSTEALTANGTYANTGNSTFSVTSQVYGTIGANTIVITNGLRGGNVTGLSADLPITTNVHINNSSAQLKIGNTTVNAVSNSSSITLANSTVSLVITRNTIAPTSNLNITGNTVITGDAKASGNAAFDGSQLNLANAYATIVTTNTDIGSNVTAPQVIASFAKATYNSAKLMVQIRNTGNTQITEMVIAHDGTTAEAAVYGTVASPAGANAFNSPLGELSANVNGTNVDVLLLQTISNSSVRVIGNLIK